MRLHGASDSMRGQQIAYSSLLRRLRTVQANPGPVPPRVIRTELAGACIPPATIDTHRTRLTGMPCGCLQCASD